MERKVSESENSENDEKEKDENTKTMEKPENNSLIQVISNSNGEEKENCKATNNEETLTDIEKKEKSSDCEEESPRRGLKKDDRIFEFKSDLIFDLDF